VTTSERWRRITALFHAARERDPDKRDSFLADACREDIALRREVEAMLAGHDQSDRFDELLNSRAASAASTDAPRLEAGSQLGPYQILCFLGAGGMGHVYRAFDPRLHRDVAIKLSRARFSERFEREVRVIATLNHPNICTVYDVGPNFLVTELVEGKTLREWLRHQVPVERILDIVRQVLEALRAAHRASIVHRDLKPENVMIRFDGYVKVLDFGLATRLSSSAVLQADIMSMETELTSLPPVDHPISLPGQILGTVAYMSPEQIRGHDVDQRSDLFAVGIMFYEMLTRNHPWARPSAGEMLQAILHDDSPAIPVASLMEAELAAIVRKLLRKDPARRYASAESVLEVLGSPASVREPSEEAGRAAGGLTSIAVLPFQFLNDIESRDAWSLGFADALITVLGRVDDLTVLPTAAILKYAGASDLGRTGRELGVRHVLHGTVQKLGAHWRVSIQLFDGMTQRITFSEKYDFQSQNVFEVQDQIGREVIAALRRRFPRATPRARDRYSSAVQHLSAALESDPEFPLAHAWLSYITMSLYFSFDPRPSRLEQAEHHASRALALDPALPEGHLARASILWSPAKGFQHAEALEALGRVVAVQPNFERAYNRIATICFHIGRFEEARQAHSNARRSNPKTRSGNLEFIHLYSGDFARAEEAAEAWVRERPGVTYALWFYPQPPLLSGSLDVAEERLAIAQKQLGDDPLIITLHGMLHARREQTGLALDCVRAALSCPHSFGHTHHTYYQVACIYAVLGDTTNAMAWLERSVNTGFPCWPFFKVDPHLERLRTEPEFNQLVGDLERKYTALKIPGIAGRTVRDGSNA
jgi:eukaryotic-like serine/threonine-protein kinase